MLVNSIERWKNEKKINFFELMGRNSFKASQKDNKLSFFLLSASILRLVSLFPHPVISACRFAPISRSRVNGKSFALCDAIKA
jgi:hypothetical protein